MAKGKSYEIGVEDFKGTNVCRSCPKRIGNGPCTVYSPEGTALRRQTGHCPVVLRWADWRADKPVRTIRKARIGQGKTKQGGNR